MHVYQSCVIIFPFSAAAFYFYGLLSFCPSILFPWPKELVYFTVSIHIILPLQVTVSTTFLVFCPNTCPNCLEHEIAILCFAFDYVQPLREAHCNQSSLHRKFFGQFLFTNDQATTNQHLGVSAKGNGTQRKTKVGP